MVLVAHAPRTHCDPVRRRIDRSPIKYCGPPVAVIFNRTVPEYSRETLLYRGLERVDLGSPALLNGIGIECFEFGDPPVQAGNPDLHLFDGQIGGLRLGWHSSAGRQGSPPYYQIKDIIIYSAPAKRTP